MTIKQEPLFTQKQMQEMIQISRNWALNNPNGPIPWLPIGEYELTTINEDVSIDKNPLYDKFIPNYKKPHWLLKLLFKHAR